LLSVWNFGLLWQHCTYTLRMTDDYLDSMQLQLTGLNRTTNTT
jgi:hypothetical protein